MSLASGSGISCPNGGDFYVCQGNATQFLGCCDVDPCSNGKGSCPDSSLHNTSYSSGLYGSIPPQACVDTGLWYTCAGTSPPFMGCCLTNPCQTGSCYGNNVTAARLSDNTTDASAFETAAVSASASSDSTMHMSSLSTGAIVGIAIGSAVVALVVGIVLFCCYKRYDRKRSQRLAEQGRAGPNGTPGIYVPSPYQGKERHTLSYLLGWTCLLTIHADSNGFPSPPFQRDGIVYTNDKMGSVPSSPSQASHHYHQQRPVSQAVSWFSGRLSGHGRAPSDNPSVSSLGSSSQGGLHATYNGQQQRPAPPQQSLNTVSEMDGAEIARPMWELAGSSPPPTTGVGGGGHVYGSGYRHVATTDHHGAAA